MAGLRKMPIKLSPPPEPVAEQATAKYRRVFEYLHGHIQSGALKAGDRLPSEAELGKLFDASRITVAKAVLDLHAWAWCREDRAQARMCWRHK